jgi:hypothetical protein
MACTQGLSHSTIVTWIEICSDCREHFSETKVQKLRILIKRLSG